MGATVGVWNTVNCRLLLAVFALLVALAVHLSFDIRPAEASHGSDKPLASLVPHSIDFGSQEVGTGSAARTITVTNSHDGCVSRLLGICLSQDPVTLTSFTLGGSNPRDFVILADGCSDVTLDEGGLSCRIFIQFNPSTTQRSDAVLTIDSNSDWDGGDGENQVQLSGQGYVPDAAAPTLAGASPRNLAREVSPDTNITLTFSEAMDQSTLTTSTIYLLRRGTTKPVPARVTYDEARKRVSLNPSGDLMRGATYTVTVTGGTNGIKDLSGNALATNKAWGFTVRM